MVYKKVTVRKGTLTWPTAPLPTGTEAASSTHYARTQMLGKRKKKKAVEVQLFPKTKVRRKQETAAL